MIPRFHFHQQQMNQNDRLPLRIKQIRNCSSQHFARAGWLSATLLTGVALAIIAVILYFTLGIGFKGADKKLITYKVRRSNLTVTVVEQGTLESSENTEIKCQVRGKNTITKVVESGTIVEKGAELVRLDTLALEEAITERTKFAHLTRASAERLKAAVISAGLALKEYEEGTFRSELMALEKDLVVAKSNLKASENVYRHNERMAQRGFTNNSQLAELKIRNQQYEQQVEKLTTDIKVLTDFTRREQLAKLRGDLAATKANYAAEAERAIADESRRERAIAELEHCIVTAPRAGLVIHPSAAQWEGTPDIEEGATVHKTQVMLLMPDLDKMQVKVGVHESVVERVKVGMKAVVTLSNKTLECKVQSVAKITRPAGWWTGNVVKYDTIIKLPEKEPGLKPGMSAEVQIILSDQKDVLTVPVAAVLQTGLGDFCWVRSNSGLQKRLLELGDSNDVFIQVISGLEEDDEVVLNPLDYIDEAEAEAMRPKSSKEESENQSVSESSNS